MSKLSTGIMALWHYFNWLNRFLSTEPHMKTLYLFPPDNMIGGELHTNMFLPGAELRGPAKAW